MDFGEEEAGKLWKDVKNQFSLELLLWVCKSVDMKSLEREWGFIIPPLLAVLDDTDTTVRARGCEMLTEILSVCPPALLKRTGLGPLFEESLSASTTYLPSLTPEDESVVLLSAAIPALLILTHIAHPILEDGNDVERDKALDQILRKAILHSYAHAGEHVRIAEVLLRQLQPLLVEMGIISVKHLKDTIPLVTNILSDPLGPAHPPLLVEAAKALQSVVLNGWPRILGWRGEVLRGICVCWIKVEEEGRDMVAEEKDQLSGELKIVVEMLKAVVESEDGSVWEAEVEKLVGTDERLGELLL